MLTRFQLLLVVTYLVRGSGLSALAMWSNIQSWKSYLAIPDGAIVRRPEFAGIRCHIIGSWLCVEHRRCKICTWPLLDETIRNCAVVQTLCQSCRRTCCICKKKALPSHMGHMMGCLVGLLTYVRSSMDSGVLLRYISQKSRRCKREVLKN